MSVQTNQYLMYGVAYPYQFVKDWEQKNEKDFYDTFERFMDDNAFNKKTNHVDGIFCLFDGMNGKYIVIGRVLDKGSDDEPFIADNGAPLAFSNMSELENEFIENSIERNFGISVKGELKHYIITHRR